MLANPNAEACVVKGTLFPTTHRGLLNLLSHEGGKKNLWGMINPDSAMRTTYNLSYIFMHKRKMWDFEVL